MRNTNIIQTLILTLTLTQTLEMGRMSADDLGRLTEQLLNVQPNFDRMLYARMKRNLLLVSTLRGQETCEHARIVWDKHLRRKTSVYHLWTREISKLVLFVKLAGGPFLRRQYLAVFRVLCFVFLKRTLDFQTVSACVCWTSPLRVVTIDGLNLRLWYSAEGSVHSLIEDVSSEHTTFRRNSAKRSALVRINYVTKISLKENSVIYLLKLKLVSDPFS